MQTVFVYGTLLNERTRLGVMGREASNIRKATLSDFIKRGLNISPSDGEEVNGLVFDVDAEQLASLDRYEGTGSLYRQIQVEPILEDGTVIKAMAYQLINDDAEVFAPSF